MGVVGIMHCQQSLNLKESYRNFQKMVAKVSPKSNRVGVGQRVFTYPQFPMPVPNLPRQSMFRL